MRGTRTGGHGRDVAESQLVVGTTSGGGSGLQRGLCFVGPDDPHTFGRVLFTPGLVTISAFGHFAILLAQLPPRSTALRGRPVFGPAGSDGEQLALFALEHPVDVGDMFLGEAVKLLLGSLEVIARDVAVLLQ